MSYIDFVLEEIFKKKEIPPNPIKDKLGHELAKKYGLVYIGWWNMGKSGSGMLTFNDPERDNTTIVAKDENDLKQRYKEKK